MGCYFRPKDIIFLGDFMKNKFKTIMTFVLLFMLTLINMGSANVYGATETPKGGDILIDLKDVDLTPFRTAGKTDVIYFAEKGFNTDKFALTVYVYNYGKKELVKNSESNVINLACKFNSDNKALEYANFRLKYISSLVDNSIYKFSVVDENNKLESVLKEQNTLTGKRCYMIAGIQLIGVGNVLATDYKVGKEYRYSGYENGVSHKLDVLETIELDVKDTFFRTESGSGPGHQNQLNSVYFAVPNKFFENGYTLNSIKAEWFEYKTNPILVVSTEKPEYVTIKNTFENFVGQNIGEYTDTLCYGLGYDERIYESSLSTRFHYGWSYNIDCYEKTYGGYYLSTESENICTTLNYVLGTDGNSIYKYTVPSETLKFYMYNYNNNLSDNYLPIKNGMISADLFQDGVDDGRTKGYNVKTITVDDKYDLLSYSDTHTFWDRLCDYGILSTIFGDTPLGDNSIKNVEPIYLVKEEDLIFQEEVFSNNLLIDLEDVNEFKNYCNNAISEEKTTVLFRFALTDYFSGNVKVFDYSNKTSIGDIAYICNETVFLDFDVIHLDFLKGDEHIIYPVTSSPIDIVSPLTTNTESWLKYAILSIVLSIAMLGIYNLFKRSN